MLQLLTPLARRWRMVVLVPALFVVAAVVLSFLLPSKYTAVTTFTEEGNSTSGLSGNLAGLVGLAGQLGLSGGVSGNLSPDFLASVLESRELLDSTVTTRFPDPAHPGGSEMLLDILHVHGRTPRERLSNAVRQLGRAASPSVDQKTGIVTLRVDLRDPALAAGVANRMVGLLDLFNTTQRQTQSRLERIFVGGRLVQAQKELHEAEQQQVVFLQMNRLYTNSPLLVAEANRLERQVQTKQETYLALTKAYEDARIAEVRDTPSITVIDSAAPPVTRSSPQLGFLVVLGLFLGAIVGGAGAYALELRQSMHRVAPSDSSYPGNGWSKPRENLVSSRTSDSEP